MFATDRTLLALDPSLFQNVAFMSQRLSGGVCDVSGTTLAASACDPTFDVAGVRPGHVVSIDGVSYEILDVPSSDSLKISRLRAADGSGPIPPSTISGRPFTIDSFAPQIALAHTQVLQMLGLAPAGSLLDITDESALLNPGDFAVLEATLALKHILSTAGVLSRDTPELATLRVSLDASLRQLRHTLAAHIDRNGDGHADIRRRLDLQFLIRM